MEEIIYFITAVVYGIFIIRFILSWIGADFDIDADADLDVSDVVSFKGATHFLMGSSGWLSIKSVLTHNIQWYDFLIAFILGLVFVVILYYVYKFLMTLESKPQVLTNEQLVGHIGKIYLSLDKENKLFKYIITVDNGVGTIECIAKSKHFYVIGDVVKILEYKNSYYII